MQKMQEQMHREKIRDDDDDDDDEKKKQRRKKTHCATDTAIQLKVCGTGL